MDKIKGNLAALLKVKTLVTLMVMLVFVVMTLWGRTIPEAAMQIITMVVSFYFGTQHERQTTQ